VASKRRVDLRGLRPSKSEELVLQYTRRKCKQAPFAGGLDDPFVTERNLRKKFKSDERYTALEAAWTLVDQGKLVDVHENYNNPLFIVATAVRRT